MSDPELDPNIYADALRSWPDPITPPLPTPQPDPVIPTLPQASPGTAGAATVGPSQPASFPAPTQPVAGPTGTMAPVWYRVLLTLFNRTSAIPTNLTALPGPFANDAAAATGGVAVGECYTKGTARSAKLATRLT